MKKGKVAGAVLVFLCGFGIITLGGCTSSGIKFTKNTSFMTFQEAIDAQNYTVVQENYDSAMGEYSQYITEVDGKEMSYIAKIGVGDKIAEFRLYTFVNYEKNQLVEYNVVQTNYEVEDGEYKLYPNNEFKINFSAKQLFEFSIPYTELDSVFDMFEDINNKIILKEEMGKLYFLDGDIVVKNVTNSRTSTTSLMDFGSTRVDLPLEIVQSGLCSDWEEYIISDHVDYYKNQDSYIAVITDEAWQKHTVFNVRAEINHMPVKAMVVETSLNSYVGRTINWAVDCPYGHVKETETLSYDFSDFVEKGGKVVFNNQTLEKKIISVSTKLSDLQKLIDNKNYTITTQSVSYSSLGITTAITETASYANGEYVKVTTKKVGQDVYLSEEYGVEVGGIYYLVKYQNFDPNNNNKLYSDGCLRYTYCARADKDAQENLGKNFLAKLRQGSSRLELNVSAVNAGQTKLLFNNGNISIETLFSTAAGNVFTSFGTETVTISAIGTTKFSIPYYVYDKVIEQDADNPLH